MRSVEQCYRGRNVRVFRFDVAGVLARLRIRAHDVLERRPDVVEVRLFGSVSRGDAHPGSDADLFVIVRDGAPPFLERLPDLAHEFGGVGVGCDVIVFTESESGELRERAGAFARAVFEEGFSLGRRSEPA